MFQAITKIILNELIYTHRSFLVSTIGTASIQHKSSYTNPNQLVHVRFQTVTSQGQTTTQVYSLVFKHSSCKKSVFIVCYTSLPTQALAIINVRSVANGIHVSAFFTGISEGCMKVSCNCFDLNTIELSDFLLSGGYESRLIPVVSFRKSRGVRTRASPQVSFRSEYTTATVGVIKPPIRQSTLSDADRPMSQLLHSADSGSRLFPSSACPVQFISCKKYSMCSAIRVFAQQLS